MNYDTFYQLQSSQLSNINSDIEKACENIDKLSSIEIEELIFKAQQLVNETFNSGFGENIKSLF